jgi:PAS domain S-box-containing protein
MIILIVVMSLSPIGIIIFSAVQKHNFDKQNAWLTSERLCSEVGNQQKVLLSGAEQLLSSLAYVPCIQKRDAQAANLLFAELARKNPGISNILIADTSGLVWAAAIPISGTVMANDRRYFNNAMATGKFSSGEYAIERVLNKPALSFGYPLRNSSGKIINIAIVSFTLDAYNQLLKMKKMPEKTSLVLTDHKGVILFDASAPKFIGKEDKQDVFRLISQKTENGNFEAIGITGKHRYFAYHQLRLGDEQTPYMYVRTGILKENIVSYTLMLHVAIMGLFTLLAIRFAVYISKRGVTDKIVALRNAAQQVGNGNLDAHVADIVSGGELGELGRTFDEMSHRLAEDLGKRKQIEESLRESEAKYRTFVETANEGIWVVDKESRTTFVNVRMAEMFGYSPEEMLGRTVGSFVVPEDAENLAEQMNLRHEGKSTRFERRFLRKDGSRICAIVSATPLLDCQGGFNGSFAMINDITERKYAEDELRKAKAEAESANIAKSEFLANMSHEIRTPMNAVIGLIELLLGTGLTDEQRKYAQLASQSGRTLMELISDILDLSKIEAHKIELETREFDLQAEMMETINFLSLRAREKGLGLVSRIDPDVPLLLKGDAGRLRQIITNLAGNAIKFTDKGSVSLHIGKDAEDEQRTTLRIQIRDTGIGIASDKLGVIFEPFTQADGSSNRSYGGAGLGLAISRQLAVLMGGNIGAESVEGKGATFWFTVVLEKQTEVEKARCGKKVSEEQAGLPVPSVPTGNGISLLLVEDDPVNQLVTKSILVKCGYLVDVASNGSDAIEALERNDYALVLMDCMMPVMNGYEATVVIRDQSSKVRNHAIPVIALTAKTFKEDRESCLAAGMNDFLAKPLDVAKLLAKLKKWLPSDPGAGAAHPGDQEIHHFECPELKSKQVADALGGAFVAEN